MLKKSSSLKIALSLFSFILFISCVGYNTGGDIHNVTAGEAAKIIYNNQDTVNSKHVSLYIGLSITDKDSTKTLSLNVVSPSGISHKDTIRLRLGDNFLKKNLFSNNMSLTKKIYENVVLIEVGEYLFEAEVIQNIDYNHQIGIIIKNN